MDGPKHLLEPWLQGLELPRARPTPWQRLCCPLGGTCSLPGLGLGAGGHSDTVNESSSLSCSTGSAEKPEQGRSSAHKASKQKLKPAAVLCELASLRHSKGRGSGEHDAVGTA